MYLELEQASPQTHVETVLCTPGGMNGKLRPPDFKSNSEWKLVSVTMGVRQFPNDPDSPVWFVIAWEKKNAAR